MLLSGKKKHLDSSVTTVDLFRGVVSNKSICVNTFSCFYFQNKRTHFRLPCVTIKSAQWPVCACARSCVTIYWICSVCSERDAFKTTLWTKV